MARSHLAGWNMVFLAIMAVGYAAAIYHATSDRWGNAIIAAAASTIGTIVILLWDQQETQSARTPRRGPRQAMSDMLHRERAEPERSRWLTGSIVAGFVATIIMSLLLLFTYTVIGYLGDENGSQLSRWFYNLHDNDLAEGALDVPITAFSINLLAGLAWALVYGGFVERRLPGPGWFRGMLFSIVPWLLSLLIFFPAVGGGLFGADLDAGPLPAIGNLVLHLIFGTILGAVFAVPEVSTDAIEGRTARTQTDGTAIGLVVGLTAGLVIGATVAAFAASDVTDGVNITLVGGGVGILLGGLLGSFAGVDVGTRREVG